uniref:Uncharacterized protein n=1 Tax=Arundo donax TaxID=35708 RepID=A0A0A9CL36_ARUDO
MYTPIHFFLWPSLSRTIYLAWFKSVQKYQRHRFSDLKITGWNTPVSWKLWKALGMHLS